MVALIRMGAGWRPDDVAALRPAPLDFLSTTSAWDLHATSIDTRAALG
jgi:hypothetical protein